MMEKSSSNNSKENKRQSTTKSIECKTCGDTAKYSYFGVISCDACKVFFKRNAERGPKAFKCHFDGNCQININTRHVCSYCRLVKCLESGMQTEMIRSSIRKKNKTKKKRKLIMDTIQTKTSTTLVRLNQPEQFPTLNLLRSDQSTLAIDQWNLISNLSHCYDEYSGILLGEHYIREQNLLPLKLRFKSASMIEFFQILLDTSQSIYKNNQDFLSLSEYDRSILLHSTFIYTSSLSANSIHYQIGLFNCPAFYTTIELIGNPNAAAANKRIAKRMDFDMITMKLFLAIISFSTIRCTIYSNTPLENLSKIKKILDIQNKYIELLWRYLLYKYNFERSVICLSNLIRCLFAINEALAEAYDFQWYTDTIDSLVQQTQQTLNFND
ncbi:unnamed protein product [Rotaria sordida]|uniref:Nuclear receptor domain-containing protein n=2 Tax=Rotaria sordida TaxID=392033 RepID=A0A814N6Z7_9BILA|nr:unnamed protein product [Rotaria sordida]CAF1279836.1 unnamed protein product [Rotaria sordida]